MYRGYPDLAAGALPDAQQASRLNPLASDGWYRLRDAAEAGGEVALAEVAVKELTRLGAGWGTRSSLEVGEEGQRASGIAGSEGKGQKR